MKTITLFSTAIILISGLTSLLLNQKQQLVFDNPLVVWNGKSSVPQDTIEQDYYFKNTSVTAIRIVEVRPSCTCTTPVYTKKSLSKNEKGYIRLSTTVGQLKKSHMVDAVVKAVDTHNQKSYYKIELVYGSD